MNIFPAQSLVTNIMNFHVGMNIRTGMECIYQLFGLNKSHQVSLWNVSFFSSPHLHAKKGLMQVWFCIKTEVIKTTFFIALACLNFRQY